MAIKLLISDLDGTLLGPDGSISSRTAGALYRARQAGIPLLVATGRSWKTASPLLSDAGVEADFVLLNGAECRTGKGTLLHRVPLPLEYARRVVEVLQRYDMGYEINSDRGDFSTDTVLCNTAQPMPPLSSFWASGPQVCKIFAFSRDAAVRQRAREALESLPNLSVTASAPWNLEVTAREAQKGKTARWAACRLGVAPDEALVFGDSDNDRSLFRAFVHTRAMGNGTASLQALAERVVPSNREDGVAMEIEKLFRG